MNSEAHVEPSPRTGEGGEYVRRIANALSVAAVYAESPTIIDRMANAVNMESVLRAVYDAERIIGVGMNKGEIATSKDSEGRPTIVVRGRVVYGVLPRPDDVEKFVEAVRKDISIARRVAARAIITYNQAVSGGGGT